MNKKITSHLIFKHWLASQTPTILIAAGISKSECIMQISSVVDTVFQREQSILFSVKSIILKEVITAALLFSKLQTLAKENVAKKVFGFR